MKTAQSYTPGPWAYEMFEDSESRFGTHPIALIDGCVGYYKGSPLNNIAKVSLFEAHPEASSEETASLREITEANARLIAAAPELLETLGQLESSAENLHCALQSTAHMDPNDSRIPVITGQVVRDLLVIRDQARAAIAKATGV